MEKINEDKNYEMAKQRVVKLKNFYSNLIVFIIVFFLFYGSKFLKFDTEYWSKIQINIIFIIWGLVLLIKGLNLFLFGSNWENRKINEITKKYKEQ